MQMMLNVAIQNTIAAAALTVVAFVSSRLIKRPALAHLLWLVVLIKLMSPPIVKIPIHVGSEPVNPRQIDVSIAQDVDLTTSLADSSVARHRYKMGDVLSFLFISVWLTGTAACVALASSECGGSRFALASRDVHAWVSFRRPCRRC